ncbi:tripartite tricarboxylate transporter TctB family protein [Afifella sp. IM 167]|uniref:tripartite tricarboxylate transporter TctB family protein n=1 Tax=Afifella sp. IM 167 TaxID=2033586 RepID=UPI001CC9E43D
MRIQNAIAGGLMIALAAVAIREGMAHDLGRMANIGPGFFPLMLGMILAVLGAAILFVRETVPEDLADTLAELRQALRPLLCICGGVAAFALLIGRVGLVPATMAVVVIGGFAWRDARPMPVLLLAIGLSAFAALVFRIGLGMPMPLLKGF